MPFEDAKIQSWMDSAVFIYVALFLIITMETGKAPHVAKGTRAKICFLFIFLLKCECERGCSCVFPVVPLACKSSDFAETAKFLKPDRFTWPCPRPQPSLFYPSGMPISASLSSAPATRSMAPEGGHTDRFDNT